RAERAVLSEGVTGHSARHGISMVGLGAYRRPARRREKGCRMSLLEVRGVSKAFGSLVAVSDVSLRVAEGELRAVIGPNGAGKTPFFNMISGFLQPTAGSILFDGSDVTRLPAYRRVGIGMARTFQVTEIFPELSVFENVRIAVEVAAGYRLRTWISRQETAAI